MNEELTEKNSEVTAGWQPLPESPSWLLKVSRRGAAFRYGLGLLLVIAPLLLTFLVRRTGVTLNPTWPILICLLLISWYAGRGPCLMASFLFALALDYFFSPPPLTLKINMAELNRLLILMILAWITSARGRAEERLRRRARQQEAVALLAEQALIERDLQSVLDKAAELIARTLDVEFSMIWESAADARRLTSRAGTGWGREVVGQTTVEPGTETLATLTLTSGQPVIVKNLRRDKRFSRVQFLKEHRIVSGLGVAIPQKQGPSGALVAYSRGRHRFSKEDVSFLQACAFILAEAAERLRVEAEKEESLVRERKARAAAEEANRLKDEFLSTVSHELRTPLNSILGWSFLLLNKQIGAEEARRGLEAIDRNARSQAQIVNDILDVSRIITGKLQLALQPLALNQVLIDAAESMRPTAEIKGVQLSVNLSAAAATVVGDGARLQQVVWNLLANAIRFTPPGGRVELTLSGGGGLYTVTVRDTGEGISPDFLPFVFDRFRQADSSTTRRYGGLGLGLSIVRHLVEIHGGSVMAESEGLGKGAAFTIKLPAKPDEKEEAVRDRPQLGNGDKASVGVNLNGLSVLVIDDDLDTQSLVKLVLEGGGARVKVASSVSEALDLITVQNPQVILSDIAMPDEDGYSFIRKLRAMTPDRGGNTPAAALTAFARPEDRLAALQAGFHTHLPKPVDPAELLAVVSSLAKAKS